MKADNIREDATAFVQRCKGLHPDEHINFLVEQSKVAALYEIAAQLAELNETLNDLRRDGGRRLKVDVWGTK